MNRPTGSPPTPKGATVREQQAINLLHRAAKHTVDPEFCSDIVGGLDLIGELIEARNHRQSFTDQWDHFQAEG